MDNVQAGTLVWPCSGSSRSGRRARACSGKVVQQEWELVMACNVTLEYVLEMGGACVSARSGPWQRLVWRARVNLCESVSAGVAMGAAGVRSGRDHVEACEWIRLETESRGGVRGLERGTSGLPEECVLAREARRGGSCGRCDATGLYMAM